MNAIQKVPWPRVLGEGVIIVVSILLAFWIQAWWEERQESEEAVRVLEAIKAELQQNIDLIDQELSYRDASNANIKEILQSSSDDSSMTNERADSLLAGLLWFGTVDFPSGALDSLIQGGRLSIVDNDLLRLKLAGLPKRYAETYRLEMQTYYFMNEVIAPYAIENTFFPQVALRWSEGRPGIGGGTEQNPITYPARPESDHRSVFADPHFLGLLVWQKALHDDAIDSYRSLRSELEVVVDSIDAELN